MTQPISDLLAMCRHTLTLNQNELATLVGSSLRSVQRWENKRAHPAPWHIHKLADAVRSADPSLADQLEVWAPRPEPPPPPAPPPPPPAPAPLPVAPPPVPASVLVDSVVCAAAEAMTLAPQAVRPAIVAAFARAKEAGLSTDAVVTVLAPPKAAGRGGEAKKRG